MVTHVRNLPIKVIKIFHRIRYKLEKLFCGDFLIDSINFPVKLDNLWGIISLLAFLLHKCYFLEFKRKKIYKILGFFAYIQNTK